ncbi:hypothetical protein ACLQ28_31550 [Micromonospora sp. DT201]|uniref:hypothetical protein n=1 Tax=Micromonospora sp. DT201 TaxID=3393442 RepID=UPI003CE81E54
MSGPFPEYRDISVTDPLRQGDIIEAVEPVASMWQRHLLVLTADCDFAHAKHQGRVTCVPLLTANEYLLEMKVPLLRERALAKVIPVLRQVLPSPFAEHVSDERLRAWPGEVEPNEIVATLGLADPEASVAKAILEAIRLVSQPAQTLDDAVERLIAAHLAVPNAQKRDKIVQQIVNVLKNPYGQPPGDALFLSAIAPKHELGYFAYLRHLEQVWEVQIAIAPVKKSVGYRRISRLQERYVHLLVQRFALVFMSIGLPREYEEFRDLHAELLGEKYA